MVSACPVRSTTTLAYLVSIRKRPFRPIAALLSRRKMLTYHMYAPLFRLPRALLSNEIARFRMDTI